MKKYTGVKITLNKNEHEYLEGGFKTPEDFNVFVHSWATFIEEKLGLEVTGICGESDEINDTLGFERLEIHNDINDLWEDFFHRGEEGDYFNDYQELPGYIKRAVRDNMRKNSCKLSEAMTTTKGGNEIVKIRIIETNEIVELEGNEWTKDSYYNEKEGTYDMSEDDFEWWEKYFATRKNDEIEASELAEELGIDVSELWNKINEECNPLDMENEHDEKQRLFAKIREEYTKV